MKKDTDDNKVFEMQPEYDFRGGVRGKHANELRQGYSLRIHHPDGVVEESQGVSEIDAIELDPDVIQYFPDSVAVNSALRSLIALIPKDRKSAKPGAAQKKV